MKIYLVSAVIRLTQKLKSKRTADYLASLVETDVTVWHNGQWGQTSIVNKFFLSFSAALKNLQLVQTKHSLSFQFSTRARDRAQLY